MVDHTLLVVAMVWIPRATSLVLALGLAAVGQCRASEAPAIDARLGESLQPGELAATEAIASVIEASIRARYDEGSARRDAHPKAHGCVRAELQVQDGLSAALAQGIFVPGQRYRAWLRFSNGASDPTRPDSKPDARGLALKVMGVPGRKLLADEVDAGTQDFIFINHPVFFANDPDRYLSLARATARDGMLAKLAIPFALGPRGALIAFQTTRHPLANPLHGSYFSMVPYQLGEGPGRQAVKYAIRPCDATGDAKARGSGPDFLREAMQATLDAGDACLQLLVQPRASAAMSVEDSMTEWNPQDAPFIRVATVHIPRQSFDSAEQRAFCENLSFTPWHALPAHRPLGATNRIRRVVYERISQLRHAMNGVARSEPQ